MLQVVLGTPSTSNIYWAEYLGLAISAAGGLDVVLPAASPGSPAPSDLLRLSDGLCHTHPIFVEQFYFTTQMAEFNFALLMVPVAFLLIVEGARSRSANALGVAEATGCLLFLWAFASCHRFSPWFWPPGALFGLMMAQQDPFDQGRLQALRLVLCPGVHRLRRGPPTWSSPTWFFSSSYLTRSDSLGHPVGGPVPALAGAGGARMAFGEGASTTPVYIVAAVLLVCRLAVDFGPGAGRRPPWVHRARLSLHTGLPLPAGGVATAPGRPTAFTPAAVSASALVLLWEGRLHGARPGRQATWPPGPVLVLTVAGSGGPPSLPSSPPTTLPSSSRSSWRACSATTST